MLWLYRLFFPAIALALAPHYLLRMRRRGGYLRGFSDRFGAVRGLGPKRPGVPRVWLQAVSVGEVLAAGPLIEGLHRGGAEVVLTTTTSTGHALARERYAALTARIGYFPLDWPPFSARAWNAIDPDLALLTEGERWPEHVAQARRRAVPVINLNARLSDRSVRRIGALSRFAPGIPGLLFSGIDRFLAASEEDARRFRGFGVPEGRILTTGNVKLDVSIPRLNAAEREGLRRELGLGAAPILLGSSTWPGEEQALIAALEAARASGIACSLLLVPRHAERRGELEGVLGRSGLRFHFRSKGPAPGPVDIAVGDTTGELRRLAQVADLVFVGKSLPPHTGGQTPVEAAVLEKPILFGPGMANFSEIAADLLARGAAIRVPDAPSLPPIVTRLFGDPAARAALASAASAWHRDNGGAAERTLAAVRQALSDRA